MTTKDDNDGSSDWLDNVCGNATNAICPLPNTEVIAKVDDVETAPEDQDVLDHVFTRVESMSCGPEQGDDNAVDKDDSSMVWPTTVQATEADGEQKGILMQEGDALDKVFERVESIVCAQETAVDDDCSILEQGTSASLGRASTDKDDILINEVESGGGTSIETELDETSSIDSKEKELSKSRCRLCGCLVGVIVAALVVNVVLLFTRWDFW